VLLAFAKDVQLPSWFDRPLFHFFSHKELPGDEIRVCHDASEDPYGANISFDRLLALRLGGFDVNLGRKGKGLLSGEETLLCAQVRQAGYQVLMHPGSIVDHYVSPNRVRVRQLLKLAWSDGQVMWVWSGAHPERLTLTDCVRQLRSCLRASVRHLWSLWRARRPRHELVLGAYQLLFEASCVYHRWARPYRSEGQVAG
jgi:hypothetical protein